MHFVKAKGILSSGNGMNIYRGCTHGCIYCDARSDCYQFSHDFEDIEVKENAPRLLENALMKKRKKCMISTGAMSDPYMHCEDELRLTRKCLEVIYKYGFGATVLTKSDRILRDLDLYRRIHSIARSVIQMTLTTYDEALCRIIEPNVCGTQKRAETLLEFHKNGIPTVVWLTPLLPYLNDTKENLIGILDLCEEAGVRGILCFGIGVTLRAGDREYFYKKLDTFFPGLSEKYRKKYGDAYWMPSDCSGELMDYFHARCARAGIMSNPNEIFADLSRIDNTSSGEQLSMF